MRGFLYILFHPAMAGLLKVGGTARSPEDRVRELSSTGVPGKFAVAFAEPVSDWRHAEADVHALLQDQREVTNREFFRVELKVAIAAAQRVANLYPCGASEPAGEVQLVDVVDDDGQVQVDGEKWVVPPHRESRADIAVDADLRRMKATGLITLLSAQMEEQRQRARVAAERLATMNHTWDTANIVAGVLEESFLAKERVAKYAQQLSFLRSREWEVKPGYWYYESKVYQVRGEHLLREEKAILVTHYAEEQHARISNLLESAKELRRRNRK